MPNSKGAFYCKPDFPVEDADDFYYQWLLRHFLRQQQKPCGAPASGLHSQPELGKKQVNCLCLKSEDGRQSVELQN